MLVEEGAIQLPKCIVIGPGGVADGCEQDGIAIEAKQRPANI
jgi:hypothetical protein